MAKKKPRLNRRGKQVIATILMFLFLVLLVVVFVGVKLIQKYSPTKERMTYQDYFDMTSDEQVLTYMNDELLEIEVVVDNDKCYLPLDYVVDNLNCRFYYDEESNCVMYTVYNDIYSFVTNEAAYVGMDGTQKSTDCVVVKSENDILYINIDYVKERADFEYRFYKEPYRLFMYDEYVEKTYAKLNKDIAIRYRGGIKSPIIFDGLSDQEVEVLEDLEDWIGVRTEDGFFGYVQTKYVGEQYTRTMESTYVEEQKPESQSLNKPINLVFQAVGTSGYSGEMLAGDIPSNSNINVISPTWYSLNNNVGGVDCRANKSYVEYCHKNGIQVWALVDDFSSSVDKLELLRSKTARTTLINRLIDDANTYGFDGINIDFEKISVEAANHYLQFLRELSFKCRDNGIILSVDNYAPASFNRYYNRKEQGIWIDYSIIMGYDEYHSASETAGPVASIGYVENGIIGTIEEVPKEKVINAMPFYVRVWRETPNSDGTVKVTSRALAMDDAKSVVDKAKAPIKWDEATGMYYASYSDSETTVKVWLENADTIEEKMKLYQKYEIAGVAGWRMGLENKLTWVVINKYLNNAN